MTRNLKVLLAAAMALAALGAIAASSASAALFHCEKAEPCRATLKPDETAGTKTAHHVFIVKGKNGAGESVSGSFTCNQLTGEGTAKETSSELTITGLAYDSCNIAGTPVTVDMNGCDYLFAAGPPGTVTVTCPEGKQIELTVIAAGVTKCVVTVGSQGPLAGITYHDAKVGGVAKTEITVEALVKNIHGFAHKGCLAYLGFEGTFTEAEYTTGNTIVTGETTAGVHVATWYE